MSEPPPGTDDQGAGESSQAAGAGSRRRRTTRPDWTWPARSPTRSAPSSVEAAPSRPRGRPTSTRSGPGPGPTTAIPSRWASALEHLVDAKGWSTDLSVRALLARWPLLVGPTNAAHSWPESYADTVLTVRTESTVWATSLRTMAPQLVAKLNDAARRRHRHPGQGARSAGPVLEEGPAVGPGRPRSSRHVRLTSRFLTRPLLGDEEHEETVGTTTTRTPD